MQEYKSDANARISEANARAAEANKSATKAQLELKKAQLELERIKSAHADRSISAKQRVDFLAAIKLVKHKFDVNLSCTKNSPESVAYCEEVYELLKEAGFNVEYNRTSSLVGFVGAKVFVSNAGPESGELLDNAFRSLGLDVEWNPTQHGMALFDVSVMIGYKPFVALREVDDPISPVADNKK